MRLLPKSLIAAVLLCSFAPAADAGSGRFAQAADAPRLLLAQSDCTSLNQAIERVRRQYNGRIVSAETRTSGNQEVHHIKVLTEDGKVRTVRVPGCTRRS